jgi:hypothetical protein
MGIFRRRPPAPRREHVHHTDLGPGVWVDWYLTGGQLSWVESAGLEAAAPHLRTMFSMDIEAEHKRLQHDLVEGGRL